MPAKEKQLSSAAAAMPPHPTALHSTTTQQVLLNTWTHHFSGWAGQGLPIAPAVSRLSASWGLGAGLALALAADAACGGRLPAWQPEAAQPQGPFELPFLLHSSLLSASLSQTTSTTTISISERLLFAHSLLCKKHTGPQIWLSVSPDPKSCKSQRLEPNQLSSSTY